MPLSPRVEALLSSKGSAQARSRRILEFYINDVLKPEAQDPLEDFHYEITDGPHDGGLDAWVVDGEQVSPVIHVLQCKWFDSPPTLDQESSQDLYEFIQNKLLKRDVTDLAEPSRRFVGQYHQAYTKPILEAHYITNAELNVTALKRYDELQAAGIKFHKIDRSELERKYFEALSGEEPISNEIVFSLPDEKYFILGFTVPSKLGGGTCSAIQFPLSGLDLLRASDLYSRKLFTRNLRFGLGQLKKKGTINQGIVETANDENRSLFYVLHNGISITSSEAKVVSVKSADSATGDLESQAGPCNRLTIDYVKEKAGQGTSRFLVLRNFQIVNGAQSTVALGSVDPTKLAEVTIPCKVTQSSEAAIANLIAICNNSQNKIEPEDLIANTPAQALLQNYAALEIDPPVFYKRKRGESWKDVYRAISNVPPIGQPEERRHVDFQDCFQSFLAFKGRPASAYSRPKSMVNPGKPFYAPICSYSERDEVFTAALAGNYEEELKGSRGDPDFTKYWKMWALALFGYVYRKYFGSPDRQARLRRSVLSKTGFDKWRRIRKPLYIGMERVLSTHFPDVKDQLVLNFFRGDEEVLDLRGFRAVSPSDLTGIVDPKIQRSTLMDMRRVRDPYSLDYAELDFGVIAALFDKEVKKDAKLLDPIGELAK